jgi:hypothetical protein
MNARAEPVAIEQARTGSVATHEVRNQARPALGFNAFDDDRVLSGLIAKIAPWAIEKLSALGAHAGRPLHAPTEMAIDNTVTCFSGTEITLDNEWDTNPILNEAAQNLQAGYGLLEWPALRRRLDRLDGGYAQ